MNSSENPPQDQAQSSDLPTSETKPLRRKQAKYVAKHRWKPGQSGNPKGKPPIPKAVVELARAHTEEAIAKLADWMRGNNAAASIAAARIILERAWGLPKQQVEVSGEVRVTHEAVCAEAQRIVEGTFTEVQECQMPPLLPKS